MAFRWCANGGLLLLYVDLVEIKISILGGIVLNVASSVLCFMLQGYLIPKGWTLICSIRETQQTSPIFDESERFKPERWESIEKQYDENKFQFIPFSGGPRGCIGKDYALILTKIFVIELARKCDWTLKNPNPTMRYIPIPLATDHLPINITRRPSNAGKDVSKKVPSSASC